MTTQLIDEYVVLVERVNDMESSKYTIGEYSSDGDFQQDAKKIRDKKMGFNLIHAKLYLCALMQDPPVTESNVEMAIERVDEIHEGNIKSVSQKVLMRLT